MRLKFNEKWANNVNTRCIKRPNRPKSDPEYEYFCKCECCGNKELLCESVRDHLGTDKHTEKFDLWKEGL